MIKNQRPPLNIKREAENYTDRVIALCQYALSDDGSSIPNQPAWVRNRLKDGLLGKWDENYLEEKGISFDRVQQCSAEYKGNNLANIVHRYKSIAEYLFGKDKVNSVEHEVEGYKQRLAEEKRRREIEDIISQKDELLDEHKSLSKVIEISQEQLNELTGRFKERAQKMMDKKHESQKEIEDILGKAGIKV